jgi:hypothetical protein
MLFGYEVDPDFDLGKEQRTDRVSWFIYAAVAVCAVYLFAGGHFVDEVLQGSVATILCYGANFYANLRSSMNKPWLWKAILATIPLHVGYLALIFWSDRVAPEAMTKALVFIPVLGIGFGIESVLIDHIVAHFKPSD